MNQAEFQDAVLQRLARLEGESARVEPIGNLDFENRAAGHGKMIGNGRRLQHPHRAGRHRTRSAVERRVEPQVGIGGIDDDRRDAVRIERSSKSEPDQPPAENDDVCPVHRQLH